MAEPHPAGPVSTAAAEVYADFFVPALFAQWTTPVLQAAGVRPGDAVLDIGCGTGVLARAAAGVVGSAGSVVGVDPNEGMLAVARRSAVAVTWTSGKAETLRIADERRRPRRQPTRADVLRGPRGCRLRYGSGAQADGQHGVSGLEPYRGLAWLLLAGVPGGRAVRVGRRRRHQGALLVW